MNTNPCAHPTITKTGKGGGGATLPTSTSHHTGECSNCHAPFARRPSGAWRPLDEFLADADA